VAACVSIKDCRRRKERRNVGALGKGSKDRASVESAVQVPMSIHTKKNILFSKPVVLASSKKRIDVCWQKAIAQGASERDGERGSQQSAAKF